MGEIQTGVLLMEHVFSPTITNGLGDFLHALSNIKLNSQPEEEPAYIQFSSPTEGFPLQASVLRVRSSISSKCSLVIHVNSVF